MSIRREYLTCLQSATAIFAIIAIATCGVNCGDDDATDSSLPDGGQPDGTVYDDAWSPNCPSTLDEGHICIKGIVKDLVTKEPVALEPNRTMRLYYTSDPESLPRDLYTEVPVNEDGRFVFPSIEKILIEEVACLEVVGCKEVDPQPFYLELHPPEEQGYLNIRNKYGIYLPWVEGNHDRAKIVYYLVPQDVVTQWKENIEGTQNCPHKPKFGEDYKTVILLDESCLIENTNWPLPQLYYDGRSDYWTSNIDIDWQDQTCWVKVDSTGTRVSYEGSLPNDFVPSGINIVTIYEDLLSFGDRICFSSISLVGINREYHPAHCIFSSIGNSDEDDSGPFTIVHVDTPIGCTCYPGCE